MIPLIIGSVVLVVLGTSTAIRCSGSRSGLHPSVLAPALVVFYLLAFVPLGVALGGPFFEAAGWVWMLGSLVLLPAAKFVHIAILGIQRMAELGESRIRPFSHYDTPSVEKLDAAQASLEGELMHYGIDISPHPVDRR